MKKNFMTLLILTLIISACDTPQNNRRQYDNGSGSFSSLDDSQGPSGSGGNFGGDNSGSDDSHSGGSGLDPGYESCNLSPTFQSSIIGSLGICQNNTTETEFRVYFKNSDNGDRTCLVPTNRKNDGSSSYLGQAICSNHDAEKTYKVILAKDRPGSQSYSINGVMILKQQMLNEYFNCMDAYNQYLSSCYGYPSSCQQQAQSHQHSLCSAFKSKYQGKYIDVAL